MALTQGWEQHPVLSQRDSGRSTLEDQLPALIRTLEIGEAEAEWSRKEKERRADIRKADGDYLTVQATPRNHHERHISYL